MKTGAEENWIEMKNEMKWEENSMNLIKKWISLLIGYLLSAVGLHSSWRHCAGSWSFFDDVITWDFYNKGEKNTQHLASTPFSLLSWLLELTHQILEKFVNFPQPTSHKR